MLSVLYILRVWTDGPFLHHNRIVLEGFASLKIPRAPTFISPTLGNHCIRFSGLWVSSHGGPDAEGCGLNYCGGEPQLELAGPGSGLPAFRCGGRWGEEACGSCAPPFPVSVPHGARQAHARDPERTSHQMYLFERDQSTPSMPGLWVKRTGRLWGQGASSCDRQTPVPPLRVLGPGPPPSRARVSPSGTRS